MSWEIVIGLEIHAQLAAESKIFSAAATTYCQTPNTQVREVDAGLPGALPVLNRRAVECAMLLGRALSATVNRRSEFARKNYFYPDLPKGYQISQFEYPVVSGGEVWIQSDNGGKKRIGVTRAHLEEDAGKLTHENLGDFSGVDLNRAGVPLLEIVSEPDLRDIHDAVLYATEMRKLVRWLGICDGNMQEGSFRIDANLSVRRSADAPFGVRCEIKNLNSFRFMEQALEYERQRQIAVLEGGGDVIQETRLYDPDKNETRAMRGKEDAHDYRYFPDPDLPPLLIDDDWLARVAATMPELPQARCDRYIADYGLSAYDAGVLTADRELSDYYDAVLQGVSDGAAVDAKTAKLCANWINGDFAALLNEHHLSAGAAAVGAGHFAGLIRNIRDGVISGKIGKDVLLKMWDSGKDGDDADIIIERDGLRQISDDAGLEKIAAAVIAANPKQVEQYRGGRDKLFGFFVGQVMKETKGRANPEQANKILKRLLG